MAYFKGTTGRVTFSINSFPSNCGMTIIHEVGFEISQEGQAGRDTLYKEFNKYLKSRSGPNKLVMTDAVYSAEYPFPSIYEFCTRTRWRKGKQTYNDNSGNFVVIFETDTYKCKRQVEDLVM